MTTHGTLPSIGGLRRYTCLTSRLQAYNDDVFYEISIPSLFIYLFKWKKQRAKSFKLHGCPICVTQMIMIIDIFKSNQIKFISKCKNSAHSKHV